MDSQRWHESRWHERRRWHESPRWHEVARTGAAGGGDPLGEGHDLAAIMRRLAAGDEAAVVTLYERYGGRIAAAVRRIVARRPVRLEPDEIDGLALEVCFELATVAGAWSPAGGALPWVWARHRVANTVDRVLGLAADPLDDSRIDEVDQRQPPAAPGRGPGDASLVETLARVAPDLESASLLAEALDRTRVSVRDRELLLEYAYEKHSGNASPAATVAPVFGMKEVAVRQAARRTRRRVLDLATSDEHFAPLAQLPLLA
ncbi:MAG TPA: hypothetical protein VFI47_12950 [Acidimicrobiales bacterium]|nr:hypothetical protein [Acidimicrobiales bacterium]